MPKRNLGHPTLDALPQAVQKKAVDVIKSFLAQEEDFLPEKKDISAIVAEIIGAAILLGQNLEPIFKRLQAILAWKKERQLEAVLALDHKISALGRKKFQQAA